MPGGLAGFFCYHLLILRGPGPHYGQALRERERDAPHAAAAGRLSGPGPRRAHRQVKGDREQALLLGPTQLGRVNGTPPCCMGGACSPCDAAGVCCGCSTGSWAVPACCGGAPGAEWGAPGVTACHSAGSALRAGSAPRAGSARGAPIGCCCCGWPVTALKLPLPQEPPCIAICKHGANKQEDQQARGVTDAVVLPDFWLTMSCLCPGCIVSASNLTGGWPSCCDGACMDAGAACTGSGSDVVAAQRGRGGTKSR